MQNRLIGKITVFSVSLFLTTACAGSSVKQTPKPAQPIEHQQVALKSWNEGAHRLPRGEHQQQIQNMAQQFPGIVFYKGDSNKKRAALTFDDGPDNFYTPKILDILRQKGVKATFFIVGKQAQRFPEMVQRIVNEGHAIGNHSWDHPRLPTLSADKVRQEAQSTETEIQRITGRRTDLFRPPYGLTTPEDIRILHDLGFRVIDWSVDTTDWKGESANTILSLVNKEISPGGIILQHCMAGRQGELNGTIEALPRIIDDLRGKGYEFVTVPTLL